MAKTDIPDYNVVGTSKCILSQAGRLSRLPFVAFKIKDISRSMCYEKVVQCFYHNRQAENCNFHSKGSVCHRFQQDNYTNWHARIPSSFLLYSYRLYMWAEHALEHA